MVLIVNASSVLVECLTGILCTAGYAVIAASSTFIATHYMSGLRLLILINSEGHLQNICDMCSWIRNFSPELPVIVVGPDDTDAKGRMFGLGIDDYIVEPFNRDEFLARVKNRIRRQQIGSGKEP